MSTVEHKVPTIEELNDPATHARVMASGERARYANHPIRGPYRQDIVDEKQGTITRIPVLFWYEHTEEQGWSVHAQVGGNYRKNKAGEVFRDEKGKRRIENAERLSGVKAMELWNKRLEMIPNDIWFAVMEGKPWPGVNAEADADRVAEMARDDLYQDFAGYKKRVDALIEGARKILERGVAQSHEEADAAGDLAGRLARLEKLGPGFSKEDPEITKEMREAVHKTREIVERWKPVYQPISLIVGKLKSQVIFPFQKMQQLAAEKRIAEAKERGVELSPETAKAAAKVSGGGRTISIRTWRWVSAFTDYDAALQFVKDDPEIKELVMKICSNRLRKGDIPPGCKCESEERSV